MMIGFAQSCAASCSGWNATCFLAEVMDRPHVISKINWVCSHTRTVNREPYRSNLREDPCWVNNDTWCPCGCKKGKWFDMFWRSYLWPRLLRKSWRLPNAHPRVPPRLLQWSLSQPRKDIVQRPIVLLGLVGLQCFSVCLIKHSPGLPIYGMNALES